MSLSDKSATLQSIGIKSGEQLTLKKSGSQTGIIQGYSVGPYVPISSPKSLFVRRTMPSDNSCLFHSCSYVLKNKSRTNAQELRQLCANIVAENPKKYNNAFLGMPNLSYTTWILNKDTWGGAIELSILSDYFSTEIVAFDTANMREDKYGENRDYSTRALIVYTGNHYDALALVENPGSSDYHDQVIFNTRDEHVMKKARDYAFEQYQKHLGGGQ
ncbi:ubiquitin thioesterase OTU1 [Acrasis kona]|uniref:Ubiquitin thioesterase OTU n=1 Tax=Acrasis kona TaxID=1008807 RepID=A0AAW2YJ37_9EUKA